MYAWRQDLEKVYELLFRCLGNGTQLAMCSVSWMQTRLWVGLVIDPIVFEPVGIGQRCDVLKTHPSFTVVLHGVVGVCYTNPPTHAITRPPAAEAARGRECQARREAPEESREQG